MPTPAGSPTILFGISAMLGYRLVLRIRDLPSKRLYVLDPAATPTELRSLVGGKAREALIVSNWPDLFRCAATMSAGQVAPSRILRKLATYPPERPGRRPARGRPDRAHAVHHRRILDTGMQRRAQAGLNLLTAIIVYWNTLHLSHAVEAWRREGLYTPYHLLAHVSPLGWARILLTGEYLWPKDTIA